MGLFYRLFSGKMAKSMEQFRRARIDLLAQNYTAIYALSDIHGCHDELIEAEKRIVADAAKIPGRKLLMFLGDYVDRGPRSSDVLQHLCDPPPTGFDRYSLLGNHDDVFLKFLDDPHSNRDWLEYGSGPTLASYGVDMDYLLGQAGRSLEELGEAARRAIPPAHVKLLRSLPVAVTVGSIIFVHAGIQPNISLAGQTDDDLIWIREPFLSQGPQLPVLVVHGHTPSPRPTFGSGRIGIDTAVSMGGTLTVLKIADGQPTIL
ncbi:metallophosphoesterase family protein [Rhizobium lusitanum]|uniref:metallophosphoesterase family protein n=1 Tax=Rhizobium lusitanum TaxID=293958 RepID=UPI002573E876|nr:metallophosphoesterase family protein [Rhizobium lusitanum]